MKYEAVIGLEVHAQLLTASKMFCGCTAAYAGAPPNTVVCPICLGMPGVLPVINRRAVEFTIRTALALNCEIPEASKFDRKNYPYPDLPKGYQISQYDLPFSRNGWLEIVGEAGPRRIGIERVHLEEDTGKLTHLSDGSLVDFNRSGVPLMEIVSRPDIRTPAEARAYLQKLRLILRTIGVSSGNMEEGSFRCDANISLRPSGQTDYGVKAEVKNMNSFRSVQRALEFEIERQTAMLERGERVVQETRGWFEDRGVTVSQRSKEFAHDYRYFPEPDLPPVFVSREWVAELERALPELPDARRERFAEQYQLSAYDAAQLTSSRAQADFFEQAVARYPKPKQIANWIQGDLARLQHRAAAEEEDSGVTPEQLTDLIKLVDDGALSIAAGRQVLGALYGTRKSATEAVEGMGLAQISDESELERWVSEAISSNPRAVEDYRAGKSGAINFLAGQVMRASQGKANPNLVRELVEKQLG